MNKQFLKEERRKKRHKQRKINAKLKKRFNHLFMTSCCYCKVVFMVTDLTVEHIVPLCLGGTNESTNITLACASCNQNKGKEAWAQKIESNKKYHEQYYSQYRIQNRKGPLQET